MKYLQDNLALPHYIRNSWVEVQVISFCSLLYNSQKAMDFRQLFLNKHNEVVRDYWAVIQAENSLLNFES